MHNHLRPGSSVITSYPRWCLLGCYIQLDQSCKRTFIKGLFIRTDVDDDVLSDGRARMYFDTGSRRQAHGRDETLSSAFHMALDGNSRPVDLSEPFVSAILRFAP